MNDDWKLGLSHGKDIVWRKQYYDPLNTQWYVANYDNTKINTGNTDNTNSKIVSKQRTPVTRRFNTNSSNYQNYILKPQNRQYLFPTFEEAVQSPPNKYEDYIIPIVVTNDNSDTRNKPTYKKRFNSKKSNKISSSSNYQNPVLNKIGQPMLQNNPDVIDIHQNVPARDVIADVVIDPYGDLPYDPMK